MTCRICGIYVPPLPVPEQEHAAWHAGQEARYELMYAHIENLIERVYKLEVGDHPNAYEEGYNDALKDLNP